MSNNRIQKKINEQLIDAIVNKNQTRVEELLQQGANPNQHLDHAKVTPLHHAAQANAIEIVTLLINAGADVYAQTADEHHTPLSIALLFNHLKLARILLNHMYPREIK